MPKRGTVLVMNQERPFSVIVAGVVVNDYGHVLVTQRRDNGHWEAPGGILEIGETFEEGVVREVREETGLTVDVERLTGVYLNQVSNIVALVYRCRPIGGVPADATSEAAAVRWVAVAETEALMNPAFAIRVSDAFGPGVASRAHDGVDLN